MLKNYIELTQEDCYCSLPDFYEKVARNAGYTIQPSTQYDCRKIRVSKEVQSQLMDYASEKCQWSGREIGVVFLSYGPKANLERKPTEPLYLAVIENDFAYRGGN